MQIEYARISFFVKICFAEHLHTFQRTYVPTLVCTRYFKLIYISQWMNDLTVRMYECFFICFVHTYAARYFPELYSEYCKATYVRTDIIGFKKRADMVIIIRISEK